MKHAASVRVWSFLTRRLQIVAVHAGHRRRGLLLFFIVPFTAITLSGAQSFAVEAPGDPNASTWVEPSNGAHGTPFWKAGPLWRWKGHHTGVDYEGAYGSPIYAAGAGRIKAIESGGAYGNHITIDHGQVDGKNIQTLYAHMSRFGSFGVGDTVKPGDIIGYVGATGNVTGPHLHFEVHQNWTGGNDNSEFLDGFAWIAAHHTATPGQGGTGGGTGEGNPTISAKATSPCGAAEVDPTPNPDGQTPIKAAAGLIGQGAITSMCVVLQSLSLSSSPQLAGDGNDGWFLQFYNVFRVVALWLVVPLILIATIHTLLKGELHTLLRIWFVFLPVAVLGGVVAVLMAQLLLNMTDEFSASFMGSIETDVVRYFTGIADGFGATGLTNQVPPIFVIWMGLMLIAALFGTYFILILREAMIYVSVAFVPIILAFFVWPSTSQFVGKVLKFVIAMILSKLIMVASIALLVAAMASASGADAQTGSLGVNGGQVTVGEAGSGDQNTFSWFAQVFSTAVLLSMTALAPNLGVKLLSNVSFSGGGGGAREIEQSISRPNTVAHIVFANRITEIGETVAGGVRNAREAKLDARVAANTTQQAENLRSMEIHPDAGGSYRRTVAQVQASGVMDPARAAEIAARSASQNSDDIKAARLAERLGAQFDRFENGPTSSVGVDSQYIHLRNGNVILLVDNNSRAPGPGYGRPLNRTPPQAVRDLLDGAAAAGNGHATVIFPSSAMWNASNRTNGPAGARSNLQYVEDEVRRANERGANFTVHLGIHADA